MSSRSIDDLRPEFRSMVTLWLADMAKADLDLIITCTLRSREEQAMLYTRGRTIPGPNVDMQHPMGHVVTNAKPGQSAHQYGLALNFVIMLSGGKPDWSGTDEAWNDAILMAQRRGLQSLRPMESAHLQHPNWKQLAGQA